MNLVEPRIVSMVLNTNYSESIMKRNIDFQDATQPYDNLQLQKTIGNARYSKINRKC